MFEGKKYGKVIYVPYLDKDIYNFKCPYQKMKGKDEKKDEEEDEG